MLGPTALMGVPNTFADWLGVIGWRHACPGIVGYSDILSDIAVRWVPGEVSIRMETRWPGAIIHHPMGIMPFATGAKHTHFGRSWRIDHDELPICLNPRKAIVAAI